MLLVGVLDLSAGMYDIYAETLQPLDLKDQLEIASLDPDLIEFVKIERASSMIEGIRIRTEH